MSAAFYFYLLNTFAYKNVFKFFPEISDFYYMQQAVNAPKINQPTKNKQKAATGGQIKLKIDNV